MLDVTLPKNETRLISLTTAINSPIVSTGTALHKMEYTNAEYFTNIVTLFVLDSNELWRNSYHSALGIWTGWENIYVKNSDLQSVNNKIDSKNTLKIVEGTNDIAFSVVGNEVYVWIGGNNMGFIKFDKSTIS